MNKADKNFDSWFADNLSSHKFDIISWKRRRQTYTHTIMLKTNYETLFLINTRRTRIQESGKNKQLLHRNTKWFEFVHENEIISRQAIIIHHHKSENDKTVVDTMIYIMYFKWMLLCGQIIAYCFGFLRETFFHYLYSSSPCSLYDLPSLS